LNEMLQICSVNIFEQAPAAEILASKIDENSPTQDEIAF